MRLYVLAAVVVVWLAGLGWPRAARADLVLRTATQLFRGVKSIELAKVGADGATATITDALRGGGKVGGQIQVEALGAAAGDEVVRVCGEVCVWGVARGGLYEILTGYIGHGTIHIPPGVIEKRALAALVAGTPAPDLCVRAQVDLADEPEASAAQRVLRLKVGGGDGAGIATGVAVTRARLFVNEGVTMIQLGMRGAMQLVGPRLTPAEDGCYDVRVAPTLPLARSERTWARALRGETAELVVAKGMIVIDKQPAQPIEIVFEPGFGLRFRSALFGEDRPYRRFPATLSFVQKGKPGAYLGLEAGAAPWPWPEVTVPRAIRPGQTVKWPVRLHGENDPGQVVGTATLTHVPDPR